MIVFCLLVLFHTSSFGCTIWSRGCCANSAELAWCARGFGNSCTCEMIALHVVYNSFTFRSPSAGWILERTQTLASILAGSWLVQRDYTGGRGGGGLQNLVALACDQVFYITTSHAWYWIRSRVYLERYLVPGGTVILCKFSSVYRIKRD